MASAEVRKKNIYVPRSDERILAGDHARCDAGEGDRVDRLPCLGVKGLLCVEGVR